MGFCRTFVLLAGANGEYTILNDMLNITNATTTQAQRAFKNIKIPKPKFIYIPQPQNAKEEMEMTETLTIITSMKSEWSRKYVCSHFKILLVSFFCCFILIGAWSNANMTSKMR